MFTVRSWRSRQLLEQGQVAQDERRLGDHSEGEPAPAQQRLQHAPGQAEAPLRRLVGIGGGADDQRRAGQLGRKEGPLQHRGGGGLDENAALESQAGAGRAGGQCVAPPVRPSGNPSACPPPPLQSLHHPPMRIPGVAVGTAEFAAHVRVERPEPHPRRRRRIEDGLDRHFVERGAALADVENRAGGRAGGRAASHCKAACDSKVAASAATSARPPLRARLHPHFPHPHWAQCIQPEFRTTGPAHSGQTRIRVVGASRPVAQWPCCTVSWLDSVASVAR